MTWIGFDIGGANIKVSFEDDRAETIPFPLWKKKSELSSKLSSIVSNCPRDARFAVTMTGELADCFESKKEGVSFIVQSVSRVIDKACFYQTDGSFVLPSDAIENWLSTAAANWSALARFASKLMPERTGILLDIGSTTTDIIPVVDGHLASRAHTDFQRLKAGLLVYTGVTRSSVNGILSHVNIDGNEIPIANELFATSLDANLYLENVGQSTDCTFTADGRESSIRSAVKRLARVVCADPEELKPVAIRQIAESVIESQTEKISRALKRVISAYPQSAKCIVISGSGEWFAKQILRDCQLNLPTIEFSKSLSNSASECAAAFAVRGIAEMDQTVEKLFRDSRL